MIKSVEVQYRGIFQKNLGKFIGGDIVQIATRMGQIAFSNGRYSDSPERNGVPCKYFAFVTPDLTEEELEAECGAALDIAGVNVSLVVDDSMVKGVEPWGWHGVRAINEKLVSKGCLIVVSRRSKDDLLKFIAKKDYDYRLALLEGDQSFAGMWVNKDDLTRERCLGAIAAVDPDIIAIDAVEEHIMKTTKEKYRAEAAREAYEATLRNTSVVSAGEGAEWNHEIPELPKWQQLDGTVVIAAVKRGFKIGPKGQNRNDMFKRGTTKTERPVVRFDLCIKCTLCWMDCPDECFDPTDDGLYDITYEYCVGCHKCADVCPVPECIVMASELNFENDDSPWEHHKRDPEGYIKWAEEKKGTHRIVYNHVTGTGFERPKGTLVPPQDSGRRIVSREVRTS